MEQILNAKLGEQGSVIRAAFKKTINIRQYESEVVEMESTLTVDEEISGAERALLVALLQAQLEYTAYATLVLKRQIPQEEFNARKAALEDEISALKTKAESVLGKSVDKYL